MSHPRLRWLVVVAVAGLVACSSEPTGPPASSDQTLLGDGDRTSKNALTVMTRNMFVGADVDAVIAAIANTDPSDDLPALVTAIQTFAATDLATRVKGFANEIARNKPHAIGLQEVSTINIDLRPLGMPVLITADFMEALARELRGRGLHYQVAARTHNFTAQPPLPGGAIVSLGDDDVLLVDRDRVTVLQTFGGPFAINLGPVAAGVDLTRGWVAVRARVEGTEYFIASTHLESDLGPVPGIDQLRAAQMQELLGYARESNRAIVMGDLNDDRGSLMYQLLQGAGYADVWVTLKPGVVGLTCCHDPTLMNPEAIFTQVRDYAFFRGAGVRGSKVELVGLRPPERLAGPYYPIWPSDHAGVVARLVTVRDPEVAR